MTDKKKIRTEIERLINEPAPSHDSQCNWEDGYWCALYKIEEFIDSLQKEPVSDDLEEASRNYADNEEYGDDVYFAIIAAFKAGAKWQEEKDNEEKVLTYKHGFNDCKEQMMAKGVDGVVHHFEKCGVASVHYKDPTGVPMSYFISPKGLVAGDKVKVIAIKED